MKSPQSVCGPQSLIRWFGQLLDDKSVPLLSFINKGAVVVWGSGPELPYASAPAVKSFTERQISQTTSIAEVRAT